MRSYGIVPEEAAEHGKAAHLGKFAEPPVQQVFWTAHLTDSFRHVSTLRRLLASGTDVPWGSYSDYPVLQRVD